MANEITVSVDQGPAEISVDLVVVEGKPGRDGGEGPPGPPGADADGATDPGDLTLLFDNKLIG